jgi:hypothetical protein
MSRMSENVGASASRNCKGLHGLYRDNFTFYLYRHILIVKLFIYTTQDLYLYIIHWYKCAIDVYFKILGLPLICSAVMKTIEQCISWLSFFSIDQCFHMTPKIIIEWTEIWILLTRQLDHFFQSNIEDRCCSDGLSPVYWSVEGSIMLNVCMISTRNFT